MGAEDVDACGRIGAKTACCKAEEHKLRDWFIPALSKKLEKNYLLPLPWATKFL